MSLSAAVIRELVAAGLAGDALVSACERIEGSDPQIAQDPRTPRQKRNARYYASKASEKRLNRLNQDVSDGDPLSPSGFPPTPPFPKPQSITPSPPKGGSSPEIDAALDAYSETAKRAGLAEVRIFSAARRKKLGAILKAHGLETWREVLRHVEASNFCRGINERGWKVDLDFLLQGPSFVSILEGKYENRKSHRTTAPPERSMDDALDDFVNGKTHDEHPGPTIDASFSRADFGGAQGVVSFDAFAARQRS